MKFLEGGNSRLILDCVVRSILLTQRQSLSLHEGLWAYPRNVVLKKTCVEVTGSTNAFIDSMMVSSPGSHGSKDVYALADVGVEPSAHSKVMFEHLLSLQIYWRWP